MFGYTTSSQRHQLTQMLRSVPMDRVKAKLTTHREKHSGPHSHLHPLPACLMHPAAGLSLTFCMKRYPRNQWLSAERMLIQNVSTFIKIPRSS